MSNYDFRDLSPIDFEELVRDLLQAEFQLLIESFGLGPDQGIDFRFATASGGIAIVQAKHYVGSGFKSLLTSIEKEDAKVKKLNPKRYIIATSVSLSPMQKEKLIAALPSAPLVASDVFGREDINNLLGRHPKVEKSHFKLWLASTSVLERILHNGLFNRTTTELEQIRSTVPKFVENESVRQANKVLEDRGSLIISGEPGVGKTTLARMLVWMHAQDDWKITVIDDVADIFTAHVDGQKHLIFFDDFLGQVRLTPDWVRTVDQRLPPFLKKVQSNKLIRFVMTTRDYILHQAQSQSERLASTEIKLSEFTLNVGLYTRSVKARMLFNHICFSDLTTSQRSQLLADNFYLNIIKHRNFNPRIISLLTSSQYLDLADKPIREVVLSVLENPQVLWEIPYRHHISEDGRALMLAKFFNQLSVPLNDLRHAFLSTSFSQGRKIPESEVQSRFRNSLKELEGSVFAIENGKVSFSNPGVQDFLERVTIEDQLLPTIIKSISGFEPTKKAFDVWRSLKPTKDEIDQRNPFWISALQKVQNDESVSAFEKLALAEKMRQYISEVECEHIFNAVLDEFDDEGIEDIEIENAVELLQEIRFASFPSGSEERLRRSLSQLVGGLFETKGIDLYLSDFNSLSEKAIEYAIDRDAMVACCKSVIVEIAADITYQLDNITSPDELDEFESDFKNITDQFGVSAWRGEQEFADKRDELRRSEVRNYESNWRPTPTVGSMSDQEIVSLFSTITGVGDPN